VATSATPAVYALRFRMPLYTAACYRTAPARWRVEISDEIPTRVSGHARPIVEILADLNRHLEQSIRRDPANWFWQQPRWDDVGRSARRDRSKLGAT
jgi:lauroyl/myristoyl acyltransferase